MDLPQVRSASHDDADAVYHTLVLAFAADPLIRWIFPKATDFLEMAPRLFCAHGGRAFDHGTADVVGGAKAAALWLPPGVNPDEEGMLAAVVERASDELLALAAPVFEEMDAYHPKEPHWYLADIGADPAMMGQGLGAALLKTGLQRCDAAGQTAYLESSNPRNISLYERHGFEIIGRIQHGESPTMTPMLRPPR
ncbi:MAG: GNAT family N-acetyltransferase [Congregibacter sp.]